MEEKEVVKSGDVGNMEEVFGKDDSMFQPDAQNDGVDLTESQIEETTETEEMKENAPLEVPVAERKKDIPEEVEITHLKHPVTGHIFAVNDTIIKQRHLRPCTEEGKLVHDNRMFNRFN